MIMALRFLQRLKEPYLYAGACRLYTSGGYLVGETRDQASHVSLITRIQRVDEELKSIMVNSTKLLSVLDTMEAKEFDLQASRETLGIQGAGDVRASLSFYGFSEKIKLAPLFSIDRLSTDMMRPNLPGVTITDPFKKEDLKTIKMYSAFTESIKSQSTRYPYVGAKSTIRCTDTFSMRSLNRNLGFPFPIFFTKEVLSVLDFFISLDMPYHLTFTDSYFSFSNQFFASFIGRTPDMEKAWVKVEAEDIEAFRGGLPLQVTVPRDKLVAAIKKLGALTHSETNLTLKFQDNALVSDSDRDLIEVPIQWGGRDVATIENKRLSFRKFKSFIDTFEEEEVSFWTGPARTDFLLFENGFETTVLPSIDY